MWSDISLAIDWKALWTLVAALCAFFFLKNQYAAPPPYFKFSALKNLNTSFQTINYTIIPKRLYQIAFALFSLAFIDPHFNTSDPKLKPYQEQIPTEGTAIFLALDQSGSMREEVTARTSSGRLEPIVKLDLLKNVTREFISNRPSDLIGIVAFARIPRVLTPLTLNRDVLIDQLDRIQVVSDRKEDGTGIGYAIYKIAHLIEATRHFSEVAREHQQSPYDIKSALIMVVTDGLQDPNPLDKGNRLKTIELDEVSQYLKEHHIKLYVVNTDPIINAEQFAPNRRQLKRITTETGGDFFLVNDRESLQEIYSKIDQLEKGAIMSSGVQQSNLPYRYFSFYPFLIGIGLVCLAIGFLLDTTLYKIGP